MIRYLLPRKLAKKKKQKFERDETEDFAGGFVGKETWNRRNVVRGFCVSFHYCDSFMMYLNF